MIYTPYYVTNDLHGSKELVDGVVDAMSKLNPGDTVILNGDCAGSRGPIMNNIVKVFHEVRRGGAEIDDLEDAVQQATGYWPKIESDLVFRSVHSGIFLKELANRHTNFEIAMRNELHEALEATIEPISRKAKEVGIVLIYLPGNCETVPDDFDASDITSEEIVPKEKRFYYQLSKEGYFERHNITYVEKAMLCSSGTLLVSTHLLRSLNGVELVEVSHNLRELAKNMEEQDIKRVVAHFPPVKGAIARTFDFWTPDFSEERCIEGLKLFLSLMHLDTRNITAYFGHIYPGPFDEHDELWNRYCREESRTIESGNYKCVWVRPGALLRID